MISKEALTLLFLLCACGAATSIVLGRRKRAEAPEKTRVRWAADDAPYRYSEQKDEPLKPPRPRPGVLSRGLDALAELVERVRDFYSNLSERGRQKALIIATADSFYLVRFAHKSDAWDYKPKTLSEFQSFKLGDKKLIRVGLLSGILTDVEVVR